MSVADEEEDDATEEDENATEEDEEEEEEEEEEVKPISSEEEVQEEEEEEEIKLRGRKQRQSKTQDTRNSDVEKTSTTKDKFWSLLRTNDVQTLGKRYKPKKIKD
jgi:hypothetical protein